MLRPSITLNRRVYQRLKGESTGRRRRKREALAT
jgi:hypothetical protein